MNSGRISFLWVAITMLACIPAHAAIVTYHMSYNDDGTGAFVPGAFAIYATTSAGDNGGLFAYGIDLRGPALDFLDNYGQGVRFIDSTIPRQPTKHVGFLTGYTTSVANGTITGVQDLSQTTPPNPNTVPPTPGLWGNMIPLFGVGQEAGDLSILRPPGYDVTQEINGQGTAYGSSGFGWTNGYLLAVGYTSGRVTDVLFDTTSVDHKAGVWVSRGPAGPADPVIGNMSVVPLVTYSPICISCDPMIFTLNGQTKGQNQAVGGSIAVTGSNGAYVSEVDQLLGDAAVGNAPIQTIGDEAGNVYVMAKLSGSAAAIQSLLDFSSDDVGPTDPQYAALHAAYDARFGPGGFNALFKFPNVAGPKTINWDLGFSGGVTVDQLAAVPEPGIGALILLCGLAVTMRRGAGARG